MKRARFSYGVLAALGAVLAITLIQGLSSSGATSLRSEKAASADVDISNEARTLDTFLSDLILFDKTASQLNKRDTLTKDEFKSAERTANNLKSRVSGVQNAL